MVRENAVPVLKRGQASGGKTAPGKKQAAKRKGAMVLAAAAVDRGAAALTRKRKGMIEGTDEEVDELDQEERGEGVCVRTRAKRKRGKEAGMSKSKSKRIRASGTKDVQDQRYSMLPCCCFLTR